MTAKLLAPFLACRTILFGVLLLPFAVGAQDIEQVDLKRPVRLSGNISFSMENYSVNGIEARRQPFTWTLNGAPTLTVLGVQMPFQFLFGNFNYERYASEIRKSPLVNGSGIPQAVFGYQFVLN